MVGTVLNQRNLTLSREGYFVRWSKFNPPLDLWPQLMEDEGQEALTSPIGGSWASAVLAKLTFP